MKPVETNAVRRDGETFTRLAVAGVQPLALGLWLPARPDKVGTPTHSLCESLRQTVREAAEQAIPLPELPDLEFPLPEPLSA